MHTFTRHAIALAAAAFATQAAAQVTLYDRENLDGITSTTVTYSAGTVGASSLVVLDGNTWEVCDDFNFRGYCTRLQHGQYPTLASMGHRNRIASVRMVNASNPETQAALPSAAVPPAASPADPRAGNRDERRDERRTRRRAAERN